ncbi:MAG TPA: sensor histidine kinase [Candidatus Ruania gallistercoris]|uniref:histidine kinase n=1 Tax=Candidatus Ruania gallistercoris TaxID=2838746 RepID=A0A9D2J776_9MICO|nr:sensor histidine kinase [Candidatus Ruania gallistercoris]
MAPESSPAAAAPGRGHRLRGRLRRLGADYRYVLPGLPLGVLSFAALVALTVASLSTLIIWVGALLMPLTLLLGSAFARLSRWRLRSWGVLPAPVEYLPRGRGPIGVVRLMADPRRWLDYVFETVLAFPLRLVTFVFALLWPLLALGLLTQWFWLRFLPADLVPQSPPGTVLTDTRVSVALGILFLVTLPTVIRGLAWSDAFLTNALLGGETGEGAVRDDGLRRPHIGRLSPRAATSSATRWVWAVSCFVTLALLAVAWPVLATLYSVHPALAMVLALAHSAAPVVAIRWPWAGIGTSSLASVGAILATYPVAAELPWPWPVTGIVAQCLLLVVLSLRHQWYWVAGAWSAGALLTLLASVLVPTRVPGALANGVVLVSVTAALAMLGVLERLWRKGAARAQQAEELSAEEAQRRRDLEERNRIARELHDVVAHSMSVINVQATTAQYRKPGIDASVQQEFDDIAKASRQALSEMRSLLAVLRSDDAAPTAPVLTMKDVPELVESARASGATITDSIETDAPTTVGPTTYRIVQEALSNALRHAPGAEIAVTAVLREDRTALLVEVVNTAPDGSATPSPGSGLGLAGIRERVNALGGTVEVGPTADGGFRLAATLPVDDDEDAGTTEVGGQVHSPG